MDTFWQMVGRLRITSDEEDETAELMRELEKIKRERAEQREKEVGFVLPRPCAEAESFRLQYAQEREKAAAEQEQRERDIALGNPLLNPQRDFGVKRRYVGRRALHTTELKPGKVGRRRGIQKPGSWN